jgi:hypothetical protein
MIAIQAIDHVVFRVTDVERVSRFYIDVLGARWEKKQQDIGLYQLRIGTALIDFVPVDGKLGRMGGAPPGAEGRNVDHVCFRVLPWDGEAILEHLGSMESMRRSSRATAPKARALRSTSPTPRETRSSSRDRRRRRRLPVPPIESARAPSAAGGGRR